MKLYVNPTLLGKRVRHYRTINNLSQAKLAEAIGVSTNFLGDIERGVKSPSLTGLVRLASVLDITPNELLIDSMNLSVKEEVDIQLSDTELAYVKQLVKVVRDKQIVNMKKK